MANIEPNNRRLPEIGVRLIFLSEFTPIFISCIIANKLYSGTEFSVEAWLMVLVMVPSVHQAGKIVNASYDYAGGENDDRDNNDRPPACITDSQAKWLSAVFYLVGCVVFFWLAMISPARTSQLALYLLILNTSFLHTSGFGPKYLGIGDMIFLVAVHVSYFFGCFSPRNQPDFIFYVIPYALKIEAILLNHFIFNIENDQEATGIRLAKKIINQTVVYSIFYFSSTLFSNQILSLLIVKILYGIKIEKELKSCVDIVCMLRQPSKFNFVFGTLFEFIIFIVLKLNELEK